MILRYGRYELHYCEFSLARYIAKTWTNLIIKNKNLKQDIQFLLDQLSVKHDIDILFTRNNSMIFVLSDYQYTLLEIQYSDGNNI